MALIQPRQPHEVYRGDPHLKPTGIKTQFTQKQIEEFLRCRDDPIYFVQTYMKVLHVDHGLVTIELYPYQERLIRNCINHRRIVAEQSRQSGKTTAIVAFFLWYIIFNKDVTVGIFANKESVARQILSRLQLAYKHLPKWLQHGVEEWNKGTFILENNSKVIASSTSASSGRSYSYNIILIDEAAHIDDWEDFFTSVFPTISSGKTTKVILISSVNGLNHFFQITENARKGVNDYKLISVPWQEVPGRDERWKEETLAGMNYNYEKFAQEFENEYIGSSGTLINATALKRMAASWTDPIQRTESLRQYAKPEKGHIYFLMADSSRGKGLDYSAFQVIDVTSMPYQQVCTFRDNMISPVDYAEVVYRIARTYNEAYCLIENNDIGGQVADMIYMDYEYEYVLSTESAGRAGKRLSSGFGTAKSERGIRTTKTVKNIGCSMLKMIIEQDQLRIYDKNTVDEFQRFSKKADSFQAEDGATDDLVMGLVLFAWVTGQNFFKESTDINTFSSLREKSDEDIMSDVMPFGIIDEHQFPETLDTVPFETIYSNWDGVTPSRDHVWGALDDDDLTGF
jgi:hypothetical protein